MAKAPTSKKASQKQPKLSKFFAGGKNKKTEEDEGSAAGSGSDSDAEEATLGRGKWLAPDDSSLPPIHTISDMFSDLVGNIPDIKLVGERVAGRKLRVATMCSGTESPLLAMGLMFDSVAAQFGEKIEFEHVFSCEIVPFKQAYIERNFQPPLLFRNVVELGDSEA